MYTACATVEVSRPVSEDSKRQFDPAYIQAQVAKLRTPELLAQVVNEAEFECFVPPGPSKLREDEAVRQLARVLQIKVVRNTGLLEVRATCADAQLSAKIVKTLLAAYQMTLLEDMRDQLPPNLVGAVEDARRLRLLSEVCRSKLLKLRPPTFTEDDLRDPVAPPRDNLRAYAAAQQDYEAVGQQLTTSRATIERLLTAERWSSGLKVWEKPVAVPVQPERTH